MNKLCAKCKNVTFLSVIIAIVVALSIVITALFGVNYAKSVSNQSTLTVTVNRYFYDNRLADVQAECEKELGKLSVAYTYHGEMNGDECELVYVFDETTELANVKAALKATFADKTKDGGAWDGAFIEVSSAKEQTLVNIPASQFIRAAVAVAVFALLAFIYVALRYRLYMGVTVAVAILTGAIFTAAVILLARIPFTSACLYAIVVSAVLSAIFAIFTLNKVRADNSEISAEEKIEKGIATKEIAAMTALVGGALVIVGAIATWSVRWFAISALIGVLSSALVGLLFVPAVYLPLRKQEDKASANKSGYVGAESQTKTQD